MEREGARTARSVAVCSPCQHLDASTGAWLPLFRWPTGALAERWHRRCRSNRFGQSGISKVVRSRRTTISMSAGFADWIAAMRKTSSSARTIESVEPPDLDRMCSIFGKPVLKGRLLGRVRQPDEFACGVWNGSTPLPRIDCWGGGRANDRLSHDVPRFDLNCPVRLGLDGICL